jgi:hypothetical protein
MRVPVLVAAAALLVPAAAQAKPRKKKAAAKAGAPGAPACGVTILPLVPGAQWTYNPAVAPLPPTDAIKRISPAQPNQIVITVKSVETKDADTVVTLEEKFQIDRPKPGEAKPVTEERSITTTVTCNDKKFDISPESFFFAGEPGGATNLEVSKVEHLKGTSIQLTKGAIGDAPWGEDLVMTWSQTPTEKTQAKLASGKLEMERRFTPQPVEPITTKMGNYKAEKLGLITTGRVTLDEHSEKTKPMELPANWISTLWLADGVGMVQALNSFGHMYQLVDSGNAGDRPAEGAPAEGADAKPADAPAPKTPAKKKKKK